MTESRPPILVIDDEPDVLALLRTVLLAAGFDVTGVGSAQKALDHLAFNRPALIITDIYMSDGDGYELMAALRRRRSGVPVIAISGGSRHGPQDPLELAEKLGAVATIAKPFRNQELIETVNRVIGGTVTQEAEHGNDANAG